MASKLRSFFRWFTGIDRQADPVLEKYLRKNREALERQRVEPAAESLEDHEEDTEEVLEGDLSVEPEPEPAEVVEQFLEMPDQNQGALPIQIQRSGRPITDR